METYIVRVNGTEYEVEVEMVGSDGAAAPAPAAAPKAAAKPAAKAAGGSGTAVTTGTAGKVFKIVAAEGDAVKSGDTIVILEAMKMEIPVVASSDGTVSSIVVSEGEDLASGATVAYIE
ncbi:MAG: acetyl-CoA carboxylase biotin carboxyl carrier protein subunit [Mogibacterium sp.]|nr:acetyl-CoA carboxylase biotin carboxyl carrier protein subunit [Mogibacterium sp.]